MSRPSRPALALGLLLAALTVWLAALQPWDPDTWWHLRTGRLILETGRVPKTDPYSYVLDGGPWVTFEWLTQVLFYLAWKASPVWGLELLKTSLAVIGALGFWALGGASAWALAAVSVPLLANHGFLSDRPQLFDYALLPLFLWLCRRDERPGRAQWLALPAAAALWANLHGGAAFLGAGVIGLRALIARLRPAPGRAGLRDDEAWAALAAACGAAVFVNPHGLNLVGHTSGTLFFKSRELIGEWAPFSKPLSVDGLLFAAGAAALAYAWNEEPLLAGCAAVFGLLALSAVRNLFLYQLTSAALVARAAQRRRPLPGTWGSAAAAAAAVLCLSAFALWRYAEYIPRRPGSIIKQPEQALKFLDDNNVEGRMFHSYELGGYLIGKAWPRRKVFVDGRNVEYGTRFITQAIRWHLPGVFQALDAEWSFDYAILLNGQDYKARSLDEDPRWALVFWDDAGLVYLKREARNEPLIKRFGYALLRPNRPEFGYLLPLLGDRRTSARLLAEIERSVASSPENVNAREMKAFALDALSRPNDALAELKGAVAAFPDKPGPYMSLGWWYERRGRLPEARDAYAAGAWAARREMDEMSEAYLDNNLAMVDARLGDTAEARRLLRRCLRVWPHHPRAAANLARLESQSN